MLKTSHCVRLPAIFLLSILVQQAHAGSGLVVGSGTYSLSGNETYATVTIAAPAALDTNGHTLTVTGSGGLTCAGTMSVDAGGQLVLSGGGTHAIAGTIRMQSSTSLVSITTSNATCSGSGRLIGEHNDATLAIASGVIFHTNIDVRGGMLIAGPGTFTNNDIVAADDRDRVITLASNLVLHDIEGSLWSASQGTVQYNHAQTGNTSLKGDISVSQGGSLDMNASIMTNGLFSFDVGDLQVASGASFAYSSFTSSTCTNPGTGTPYTVVGPAAIECPS